MASITSSNSMPKILMPKILMPKILTIAGSDSGGGAGLQADLKTFMAHRAYGASVVTAITVQNTVGVRAAQNLQADIVAAQIDAVLEDIGADAVKTGMLGTASTVLAVADRLTAHHVGNLVVDPVMVSTSGHRLLDEESIEILRERLIPLATIVTPNLFETQLLSGRQISTRAQLIEAGRTMFIDGKPRWLLLKGGHGVADTPAAETLDVLLSAEGELLELRAPRLETSCTHGTGCTLSAALAANLGAGWTVIEAVRRAKNFLQAALGSAFVIGTGHSPVNHLAGMEFLDAG